MLLNDDCLVAMQKLIDDGVQVDSIVTDPPYHLQSIVDRFGKEDSAPAQHGTDGAFARASKGFMGQEWDGGDIAFRKETWELCYNLIKPKSVLLAFSATRNYHRMAAAIEDAGFEILDMINWIYGSGFPKRKNLLKPSHEPIVVARKGINRDLNIDECRIEYVSEYDKKHQSDIARGQDNATNGKIFGKGRTKASTHNPEGRYPANVIHDGLQENWSSYFYCAKPPKSEKGDDNTHPTVKPQELMKYLCRLVTPKGGTVLDPFMGSGSTGMAAKDEGFEFIGIEREKEYFEIAEKRINSASPLMEFM